MRSGQTDRREAARPRIRSRDDGSWPRETEEEIPTEYRIPRIRLSGSGEEARAEEDLCRKCRSPVYAAERVEVSRGAVYHRGCFRCGSCGLALTLGNFCSDLRLREDVYCRSHRPLEAGRVDATCLHIDRAKRTPKLQTVNGQIRGPAAGTGAKYDAGALCIQSALKSPKVWERPSSCFRTAHVTSDVVKGDVIGLKYM